MQRFFKYALSVLVAVLWITNSFAVTMSPGPSNDLPAAAPARVPDSQPDKTLPPGLVPAVPVDSSTALLELVRQVNRQTFATLESFVCNEEMRRFKGRISSSGGRQIDTVTTTVSFENGYEQYSAIHQNDHARAAISAIGGAWSTGEFGTLLRQTGDLLKVFPVEFEAYTDLDGTPAAVYAMEIAAPDSPWDLQVRSDHYRVPFRTEIWVSRATGEILKLARTSTGIAPGLGISKIEWSITLRRVELNGKTWMLPNTGEYTVLYDESGRREWNELTFTAYRHYGSEVALRFH